MKAQRKCDKLYEKGFFNLIIGLIMAVYTGLSLNSQCFVCVCVWDQHKRYLCREWLESFSFGPIGI